MEEFENTINYAYERVDTSGITIIRNDRTTKQMINRQGESKEIEDLSIGDLSVPKDKIQSSEFIQVIDANGTSNILKSRYGRTGMVIDHAEFKNYKRLLQKEQDDLKALKEKELKKLQEDEDNKLNSRTKKKSFLARLFGK